MSIVFRKAPLLVAHNWMFSQRTLRTPILQTHSLEPKSFGCKVFQETGQIAVHHHDFSWIVLDNFGESEDIASILSTMSNRVAAVRIGEMMTLDKIPDHISIVSVTSRSYLYPIVYVTISNLNLNMPMLTKAQDWRARYLFRVTF